MCSCIQLINNVINFINAIQEGKTALHLASQYGHISVVRILVGAHACINLQDKVLQIQGISQGLNIFPSSSSTTPPSPLLPNISSPTFGLILV